MFILLQFGHLALEVVKLARLLTEVIDAVHETTELPVQRGQRPEVKELTGFIAWHALHNTLPVTSIVLISLFRTY